MHEGIAQLAELYPNCFRQPGQPLKIGIHNDIIARQPELQPGLIASALRTYTRSVGYLETLKAGPARIDRRVTRSARSLRRTKKTPSGRSPRKPGEPRPRRSRTARVNPQRLRIYHPAQLQPRPSRELWPDHHVSGWLASRRPHRLVGRGPSPRSDPGSMAVAARPSVSYEARDLPAPGVIRERTAPRASCTQPSCRGRYRLRPWREVARHGKCVGGGTTVPSGLAWAAIYPSTAPQLHRQPPPAARWRRQDAGR
jgi:hypothetical protein